MHTNVSERFRAATGGCAQGKAIPPAPKRGRSGSPVAARGTAFQGPARDGALAAQGSMTMAGGETDASGSCGMLIAYFSLRGNSRGIAGEIQRQTGLALFAPRVTPDSGDGSECAGVPGAARTGGRHGPLHQPFLWIIPADERPFPCRWRRS